MKPRVLIIDTDGGVDDALALLYALASPDARIAAITTVHGNVPLEAATRNVFETLLVAGRSGIPVAAGAARPLPGAPGVTATHIHGDDGLGGWTHGRSAPPLDVIGTPAPELIATLARASPASLTLVTLGPLTNAALALRHDEEGFRQLAQVVVMGGAVNVPGNVTPDAEFNVYADPLAAREVLASGVPLVLVGLDVTTKVQLTREAASILAEDSFLHCVCEQLFAFNRSRGRPEQFSLHDPLAIGIALDPSLARTEPMKLGVTTSGRTERTAAGPVVEAALHVDSARFLELFYARVLAPAARG